MGGLGRGGGEEPWGIWMGGRCGPQGLSPARGPCRTLLSTSRTLGPLSSWTGEVAGPEILTPPPTHIAQCDCPHWGAQRWGEGGYHHTATAPTEGPQVRIQSSISLTGATAVPNISPIGATSNPRHRQPLKGSGLF